MKASEARSIANDNYRSDMDKCLAEITLMALFNNYMVSFDWTISERTKSELLALGYKISQVESASGIGITTTITW